MVADVQEPSGPAEERPLPPDYASIALAALDASLRQDLPCSAQGCDEASEWVLRCKVCKSTHSPPGSTAKTFCSRHLPLAFAAGMRQGQVGDRRKVLKFACGAVGLFESVIVTERLWWLS